MDGMEAELFYVSPNIRFFYLFGGGYPEICDATKEYFKDRIASYATIYEWILQREANLIFGHDYVDVDGNGYFTVYLFSDDEIANVMGLVYPEEAQDRDIFYVNTSNYELMISEKGEEAGTVEYEKAFATIFAHELFHYMDEQARGDHERENYFMVEGMACFVASLMEKELGLIDNYGNMMFKNSYLYHPMKTNSTTGYLTSDYHVGCDFWAYIWNVYGQDTFKVMIPYHDTIEAIETVLDEDFRTVYREYLLSVLGSSGQTGGGTKNLP